MARWRWHWLDIVIAPLRWVERTRGWRRTVLLLGYLAILIGVGGPLAREASLWRIPNIAEPVDRASLGRVSLPDAQNAAIRYKVAADRLALRGSSHAGAEAVGGWRQIPTWPLADTATRDWLKMNDPALAEWLAATRQPDALFRRPTPVGFDLDDQGGSLATTDLRALIFLGMMAASRAEERGDLAGAWAYHLGVLRSVGHIQHHASSGEMIYAAQILKQASAQARNWVDDDRQTGDILRVACRDLAAVRPLLATPSDLVRASYLGAAQQILASGGALRGPNVAPDAATDQILLVRGLEAMQHLLSSEPRRSLRILRLVTAGQLAQFDRPESERALLISGDALVFGIDDHTPAPLRTIRPEALAALAESSACQHHLRSLGHGLASLRIGRDAFESLVFQAAERAFVLDRGDHPRTYGDLVPTYLDALPDGVRSSDSLVAP